MDALFVGHVARDLTLAGPRLGGTVAFSALAARALGFKSRIVTSAPDGPIEWLSPLEGIPLHRIPADTATCFENYYTSAGRTQRIAGRASFLTPDHIPREWRRPAIVHLAPIADEMDHTLARCFPDSLLCVTPQGWMRQWDSEERVSFKPWLDAPHVLPNVHAVVLSIEDVGGDEAMIKDFAIQTAILVVTRGAAGCTVFQDGQPTHISAPPAEEVDSTGAGDIFAAAFFVRLKATRDPIRSARFACAIASDSITRPGLEGIPGQPVIRAASTIA